MSFTESREWLEQRLDQHQHAIEAQLKQHQEDVALAIERGCLTLQQLLLLQQAAPKAAGSRATVVAAMAPPLAVEDPTRPATGLLREDNQSRESPESEKAAPQKLESKTSTVSLGSSKRKRNSMRSLMYDDEEDSHDHGCLRAKVKLLLDSHIAGFINFCILANTITMFVQLQWLGSLADASLGIPNNNEWPHAKTVFNVLEYCFTAIFFVDTCLQLFAFGTVFFKSTLNIMDGGVVVVTTLEVFVLTPLATSVGNVSVVRLMRLAKFTRVFKAARTFKAFKSLRVLIGTMCFSFSSTFWSLVVLFIFQLMGAIFMCQSLHDFILDPSPDIDLRMWINQMYGNGSKSFWTIFELTFSGCWPNYARRIIEEVNPLYSIFYFVYVYVVVFVATRIVAALFMKETLHHAAQDTEMMVRAQASKTTFLKQKLSELFDEADTSGDGFLDQEELNELLAHPKVILWMKELGVDINDSEMLFALLDDGGGQIARSEFVNGVTRLRGEARAVDLIPLAASVHRMLGHVKALQSTMDSFVTEKAA